MVCLLIGYGINLYKVEGEEERRKKRKKKKKFERFQLSGRVKFASISNFVISRRVAEVVVFRPYFSRNNA